MPQIGYHASHEQFSPGALLDYVRRAEGAGFQAAMCSDHFNPWSERQGQSGYSFAWLGAALQATSLPMGLVCAPGYRQHPAIVAQAVATLGELFPQRIWAAFGSGQALNESITGKAWPPKDERNRRLRECVQIITELWAGERVTRRGKAIDSGLEESCGPELYRLLRCPDGEVEVDVTWAPRHEYARAQTSMVRRASGFVALGGPSPLGLAGLDEGQVLDLGESPALVGRIALRKGEERLLVMFWNEDEPRLPKTSADALLERTTRAWRRWAPIEDSGLERPWAGERAEVVLRSELFLKLMTRPDSGAMAAAATTSLPEAIGGQRNWDYRFTWIRDAAQVAQAFFALGHRKEADDFLFWAEEVACHQRRDRREGLQLLYPLRPETALEEKILAHLESYRRSAPVRIGNAAANQHQLDIYGELLNAVYERVRLSDSFEASFADFLEDVAEQACESWHHPDFSIWEMQNGPLRTWGRSTPRSTWRRRRAGRCRRGNCWGCDLLD